MNESSSIVVDRRLRVLMIGAALDAHGGVAAVERLIFKNCPEDVLMRHVSSMSDGSRAKKAVVFGKALSTARLPGVCTPDVYYLHVAVKGSVVRKSLLVEMCIKRDRPYVLHTHGGDFDDWFPKQPAVVQVLARRLFQRARRVIVLSRSWEAYYRTTFGLSEGTVAVLPNPVARPAAVPDRTNPERFTFLFLGSMDERKGAFRAVRAFARLPQEIRRRACLLIAGNGQVRELRSEVQSNNLQDEVEVREWMNEDERNHALETSNAYVLPSLNEGLPMGLLEALSWGLPVIATPVGGIPEVIVDQANGLLVGPLDQPALTSAMSRLILDPALCQRLSRAARLTSERFDIGAYWRDLLPILRTSAGPVGDR